MTRQFDSKLFVLITLIVVSASCGKKNTDDYARWDLVGGNRDGNKYSSLEQIDTTNVQQLRVAWEYHTGDVDTAAHSQIQCNPIIVNGILYGTSPKLKLFALDAATGVEKWSFLPFDSIKGNKAAHFNLNNNRGVAYWSDSKNDHRIFYTAGPYIHAVNAETGKLIETFGSGGKVDLHTGLGDAFANLFVTHTSAPSIYKDLLITGTRVSEGMDAAPGHIRAFDVRTGELKWIFHTIPQAGEPGHETWENPDAWKLTGGANNWMGMTIDHERGIAFVPTGSASMDFYGGKRRGANLYADCLLALDANTGKRIWHFQYIHHNTWDWDPSSYPVLVTLNHDGKKVDAVAQTTKTGFVFVFERETGKPVFPIVETPVDTVTRLVNEKLWPTQPIPQRPAPFVRQSFTEKDVNPYLPEASRKEVIEQLKGFNTGRMFTPQSKEGTIIFPGFDGGAEWGGPAVDPATGMLYVNANEMPWILKMLDVNESAQIENYGQAGLRLYRQHCMSCHGANRMGGGTYPSLLEVSKKYTPESFVEFVNAGRRMMPGFQHLDTEEKNAITAFLLERKKDMDRKYERKPSAEEVFRKLPYNISGYNKFLAKDGLPAIAPPWGTLTAIDLNTGEHVWKKVLGEDERMKGLGASVTGTENYGGPVVTKGGVLFIAATKDSKFRAFNKRTGDVLWETTLPAPGFATPATYEINGKQFVVIACGGGKLGTRSGDSYVAFALE
ncbi:PQQ-binding-like beta-propeller repeat protein [Fulvivirgaceae bacterium PWU4]|uniref:PQQ-binding-like beta-propeller repeat protein n=1 Tax=Chryseosolibacter histidini TaxID=2782349 RepID=A0AAP2DGR1_9BACT|nr:PQQ-binding-like beta-propeller repeat protein [Chryseosolibacter histidini]MBT1695314.1 PQQ-binding-like beta-propeller repeat protein [Chryseosolibacter histidini]